MFKFMPYPQDTLLHIWRYYKTQKNVKSEGSFRDGEGSWLCWLVSGFLAQTALSITGLDFVLENNDNKNSLSVLHMWMMTVT